MQPVATRILEFSFSARVKILQLRGSSERAGFYYKKYRAAGVTDKTSDDESDTVLSFTATLRAHTGAMLFCLPSRTITYRVHKAPLQSLSRTATAGTVTF